MDSIHSLFWIGFFLFVAFMLIIDLGVFNKKAHEIKAKEALTWSAVWITIALAFGGLIHVWMGHEPALQYITAYVIEKSLSVDNLFVFIMIFSYFKIEHKYQHKILFWGILGALAMRAVFIGLGIQILETFHFIIYIFGAMLVYSAFKMLKGEEEEIDFDKKWIVRAVKKIFPVTEKHDGKFFKRLGVGQILHATPLFVALMVVEFTDVIFAVDSIPAVLSISSDPFIVYTSNIFAILGLRSLYFALSIMVDKFTYLKYGVSVVLAFVGLKMLVSGFYHFDIMLSLGIILVCLAFSILASYLFPQKK